MDDKVRKVSVRFNDDDFTALDDERHRRRATFQSIGYDLFMRWLREAGTSTGTRKNATHPHGESAGIASEDQAGYISVQGLSPEQIQKVEAFIALIQMGDEVDDVGALALRGFEIWAKHEYPKARKKAEPGLDKRTTGKRRTAG